MDRQKIGQLAAHAASAYGALCGYGHENTAAANSAKHVMEELARLSDEAAQEQQPAVDEREAFEAWYGDGTIVKHGHRVLKCMLDAWQARASLSPAGSPAVDTDLSPVEALRMAIWDCFDCETRDESVELVVKRIGRYLSPAEATTERVGDVVNKRYCCKTGFHFDTCPIHGIAEPSDHELIAFMLEGLTKADELLSPFEDSGWLGELALCKVREAIQKANRRLAETKEGSDGHK